MLCSSETYWRSPWTMPSALTSPVIYPPHPLFLFGVLHFPAPVIPRPGFYPEDHKASCLLEVTSFCFRPFALQSAEQVTHLCMSCPEMLHVVWHRTAWIQRCLGFLVFQIPSVILVTSASCSYHARTLSEAEKNCRRVDHRVADILRQSADIAKPPTCKCHVVRP